MRLNAKLSKQKIDKNLILIAYLESIIKGYKIKSEISSNDSDISVIVVQMSTGDIGVLFDGYLYDNFNIEIFGQSIREQKTTAYEIGHLCGENKVFEYNGRNYQILFKQMSNPTNILYNDIRRVGYTLTLQTIINEI